MVNDIHIAGLQLQGMAVSAIIGEVTTGGEITGNNIYDVIIKIAVPLIVGVMVPIVNKYLENKKNK